MVILTEHFRFFNSTEQDQREYNASEFAEYFEAFIPDGVYFADGLAVTNGTGLEVVLGTGCANIRGYFYKNDAPITFTLDPADSVLNRIDRIVIKLDIVARTMKAILKKGTLGSSPTPPILIDDASVKEIPIAQVKVNKGATSGVIVDERVIIPSLKDIGVRTFTGKTENPTMRPGDIWMRELD